MGQFIKGNSSSLLQCVTTYLCIRFDYYGSFGFGALCFALGFLYVLLKLKEAKKEPENRDEQSKELIKKNKLMSLENLRNSFKVIVKKRKGSLRHIVILLIGCFMVRSYTLMNLHVPVRDARLYKNGLPLHTEEVHLDR